VQRVKKLARIGPCPGLFLHIVMHNPRKRAMRGIEEQHSSLDYIVRFTAAERKGNDLKGCDNFEVKVKAIIWP